MTVRVAHGCRKEASLLADDTVGKWQALSLMVSGPVGERTLDVRKLAFRPFYG